MSVSEKFPGGAPDAETHRLMARLSDLQMWCVLMSQKDSGGVAAAQLIQDTRAFIVERVFHGASRAPCADKSALTPNSAYRLTNNGQH